LFSLAPAAGPATVTNLEAATAATAITSPLQNGADVSWLPTIEQDGSRFYTTNGKAVDPLLLMKKSGLSVARVRLWVNPSTVHGSLPEVLALAKRIKAAGLKLVLDIHYSDWWADPGKQNKPAAWAALPEADLVAKVSEYTKTVLTSLVRQKTVPTWVQVGNEVGNGLLWPNGQLNQWQPANFATMAALLNAGMTAVHKISPKSKTMIHLETGGDSNKTERMANQRVRKRSAAPRRFRAQLLQPMVRPNEQLERFYKRCVNQVAPAGRSG
jgi:arabinogalactan endo-1,4-beta-galactosidase